MVATAHGVDLQSLLSNVELKPLLGGVTSVTLGDDAARKTNRGQKARTERTGAPTFTSAVEVLAVDRWGGWAIWQWGCCFNWCTAAIMLEVLNVCMLDLLTCLSSD